MSRNRRYDKKCLEMGEHISPISRHLYVMGVEICEKVSGNKRNDKKTLLAAASQTGKC